MKLTVSKSAILILLVVAGLAAGTVLVAGYVDKPSQPVQVTVQDKCDGCPMQGSGACCEAKPAGCCEKKQACPDGCSREACQGQCPGCCCEPKAQAPCCPMSGGTDKTTSPCGAGGCTQTE